MSTITLPARSGARSGQIHLDLVTLGLVSGLVLLGLVMVTSASMSIASRDGDDPAVKCAKGTDPVMPQGDILDEPMRLTGQLPGRAQDEMTSFHWYCRHCLSVVPSIVNP